MSDNSIDEAIRKSIAEESVDDILAGIINSDGSFNSEYNGLFARYMGLEEAPDAKSADDIGDLKVDSVSGIQVEYESGLSTDVEDLIDQSISGKMGANSEAYESQIASERKPAFTAGGNVRYPSIGSGASEERVVFDSDWEGKAKEEADRAKRYYQNNPYVDRPTNNGFVAGGQDLSRQSYRPVIEQSTSPFVDPISEDADFERYWARQYEQNHKKSFFQEGLRVNQGNKTAGAEDHYKRRSHQPEISTADRSSDWLQPDSSRKGRRKKRDRSAIPDMTPLNRTVSNTDLKSTGVIAEKGNVAQRTYITRTEKEASKIDAETRDLRNTVAEIVDKYDKNAQEELLAKARADKERIEAEKAAQEQEALKKAMKAKNRLGVSEALCDALDAEDEKTDNSGIYDDFSEDAEEGFSDI